MEPTKEQLSEALRDLVMASSPFRSGFVVDETSGTIPLMDALDRHIEAACDLLDIRVPEVQ